MKRVRISQKSFVALLKKTMSRSCLGAALGWFRFNTTTTFINKRRIRSINSTTNKTDATSRVSLRPTPNVVSGNTANKKGTTPTATSAMPKRNAADQMFGSKINKKGTTPTATSAMPKRNAADQMSGSTIEKKGTTPAPSSAVPIRKAVSKISDSRSSSS